MAAGCLVCAWGCGIVNSGRISRDVHVVGAVGSQPVYLVLSGITGRGLRAADVCGVDQRSRARLCGIERAQERSVSNAVTIAGRIPDASRTNGTQRCRKFRSQREPANGSHSILPNGQRQWLGVAKERVGSNPSHESGVQQRVTVRAQLGERRRLNPYARRLVRASGHGERNSAACRVDVVGRLGVLQEARKVDVVGAVECEPNRIGRDSTAEERAVEQ